MSISPHACVVHAELRQEHQILRTVIIGNCKLP